ncbi:hypothetical protein SBI67_17840 [Mycolicibacterium sp. 120266]|uniref:hypothetical protein n=1 Tax=Mycolicibacterium sp. 120266 TaxID=3090601 RepID=UPI00299EEE0F|nr:hypothetical protein [Mycolicibacterium sp. 120266]MDX1873987.1 hypothetical protein [Mycolicibacterium sp. 120266]
MTPADKFQAALEELADDTAARAARIVHAHRSKAERVARLVALLQRSNAAATALADASASRQLEALTGRATPAAGVLPTDDSERLLKAARTALEDRTTSLDRVTRLARSEPLQTAQQAFTQASSGMRVGRGGYIGWIRQTNAGACELCQHWARGGRVFPPDHGMARHPSCACVQRLVISPTKPKQVRKPK